MVERCMCRDNIWELSIRWRTDSGSHTTAHSHADLGVHAASARADLCAHTDSNPDADRDANPCADTSSWALLLGWMQCMQS